MGNPSQNPSIVRAWIAGGIIAFFCASLSWHIVATVHSLTLPEPSPVTTQNAGQEPAPAAPTPKPDAEPTTEPGKLPHEPFVTVDYRVEFAVGYGILFCTLCGVVGWVAMRNTSFVALYYCLGHAIGSITVLGESSKQFMRFGSGYLVVCLTLLLSGIPLFFLCQSAATRRDADMAEEADKEEAEVP